MEQHQHLEPGGIGSGGVADSPSRESSTSLEIGGESPSGGHGVISERVQMFASQMYAQLEKIVSRYVC